MQWLDANIVVDNNEYPYHVIVFDAADNPCNLDPVIVNDGSPTGSTRTFEPRADLVHRLFVRERATAGFGCGEACLSERVAGLRDKRRKESLVGGVANDARVEHVRVRGAVQTCGMLPILT